MSVLQVGMCAIAESTNVIIVIIENNTMEGIIQVSVPKCCDSPSLNLKAAYFSSNSPFLCEFNN